MPQGRRNSRAIAAHLAVDDLCQRQRRHGKALVHLGGQRHALAVAQAVPAPPPGRLRPLQVRLRWVSSARGGRTHTALRRTVIASWERPLCPAARSPACAARWARTAGGRRRRPPAARPGPSRRAPPRQACRPRRAPPPPDCHHGPAAGPRGPPACCSAAAGVAMEGAPLKRHRPLQGELTRGMRPRPCADRERLTHRLLHRFDGWRSGGAYTHGQKIHTRTDDSERWPRIAGAPSVVSSSQQQQQRWAAARVSRSAACASEDLLEEEHGERRERILAV